MSKTSQETTCYVKAYRQARGWSQDQLAELIGVRRQAIYDIENGRYLPNTGVALRLARQFGCRVEDLFVEHVAAADQSIVMMHDHWTATSRVCVASVRGRMVAFSLDGRRSLSDTLRPADGVLGPDGKHVQLFSPAQSLDKTILLMGCDPAFDIYSAHVVRAAPEARLLCRFASSNLALKKLAGGYAHIAGTHLHNAEKGKEANVERAKELLDGGSAKVIGFSLIEEGLIVAKGNPMAIRSVADLANPDVRFVNREKGAALRVLLDDLLAKEGIDPGAINGYERIVFSHSEAAQRVAFTTADASLGLRVIARAFDLDFVPLATVRCDLVIPKDLLDHPTLNIVLDVLQSEALEQRDRRSARI